MESILIVDDDADLRFNLAGLLKDQGYDPMAAKDGREALRSIKMNSPNLVLLDIRLPGMDGMRILERMKKADKDLAIIMLTAYGDVNGAVRAMKLGAYDYITKPFDSEELVLIIKKALQTQYLSREVETLRRRLGERTAIKEVMGESTQIKQVLKQVKVIAPTNMTVILQGESGTGKELIARMIHQESQRKDRPFIAIDCGAIPETLFESELFGYEKGAFTGADDRKEGKFEQANEGTLFLDEITNLPAGVQAKLLRVIQERRLQHLGGKKNIRVDVRIMVATNTNLSRAVRAGKFREDLFHRLNEFYINMPALRDRKEDIPVLAKYFLKEANKELGKKIEGFSPDAMRFLLDYHWPGNARELKNLIKRAVLLAESNHIMPSQLPEDMKWPQDEPTRRSRVDLTKALDEGVSFEEITRKVERDLIKKALDHTGGNKVKAAKILKIHRKALYRKMERLGL